MPPDFRGLRCVYCVCVCSCLYVCVCFVLLGGRRYGRWLLGVASRTKVLHKTLTCTNSYTPRISTSEQGSETGYTGSLWGGEMKKENPPGGTMNFPAAALLLLSSVSVSVSVRLPRRLEVGRYVVVVVVSAANVCVFSLSLSRCCSHSLTVSEQKSTNWPKQFSVLPYRVVQNGKYTGYKLIYIVYDLL